MKRCLSLTLQLFRHRSKIYQILIAAFITSEDHNSKDQIDRFHFFNLLIEAIIIKKHYGK